MNDIDLMKHYLARKLCEMQQWNATYGPMRIMNTETGETSEPLNQMRIGPHDAERLLAANLLALYAAEPTEAGT